MCYRSAMPTIRAEARLRARNQLTLPDRIVEAMRSEPGDRFIVEVEVDEPGTVRLRRVRESYAGALTGVYGDVGSYLESEREGWDRR
jgi:bifunctional DNA-binding transcriptional regulator/antitoxin component of YhaV-PrlF toxin-antitoxin module